ncbi:MULTISPECIES: heme NO-binding domain-containing protein [Vibrio]|uniref:Heme NO-binding domain-containing protein n=1 Tax=Vibrio cortegadensis TaxID=1328770 RepID=A0ABV4M595_9VIBR|nr:MULTISPECIES: heme NO-binding domain-containing protein [Vibrio]MDN3698254.1 heme NO-binding domain-containing protein [Vibrio cortegadensis]NOH84002.1 guanylate cyclase [Vibrio sp. 03-59-1]RBW65225.1 guanylate cyclase [Vibrionales bacterium C3R12]
MKGIIFTEFLELVEDKFGLDTLDQVLQLSADEGVYTSVGSYNHKDLVTLIINLSKITGVSAEELQRVFGQSVFTDLLNTLPPEASLLQCNTTFQFIHHVEDYIHVEVKKLYPDAQPPQFNFISETSSEMVMDYRSARCMSHVCLGLIEGCAAHFSETIISQMEPLDPSQSVVRFHLRIDE